MKITYVELKNISFEEIKDAVDLLPKKRREKIARYRFEKDKLLSLAAGLLIRREIGESPLTYGEHGKPYAAESFRTANHPSFFSVSHSGNIAAIAVDDRELGLDVELIPSEDRLRLADRFYHPNERDYVRSAPDQPFAFCEIWTRKEAYLKMTGEGISTDLTAFDTTSFPLKEQLFTAALAGYCLSVCSEIPIDEGEIQISNIELKSLLP